MEKQQTAVEWLEEKLLDLFIDNLPFKLLDQAKEMEKEQIIDAFGVGCQVESTRLIGYHDMAEQYYNETFKNK
jgi:hypothetical protein